LNYLVRLGPGAFQTISGEVVKALLCCVESNSSITGNFFWGIDTWNIAGIDLKAKALRNSLISRVLQSKQKENPDCRISFCEIDAGVLLSQYAEGLHGQGTFDKLCFVFQFWEIPRITKSWELQQSTPKRRDVSDYGAAQIFRWENGKGLLYQFMQEKRKSGYTSGKWRAGVNIWGSSGVAVSGIGYFYIRQYLGRAFDENVAVVHPKDNECLESIFSYITSDEFLKQLKLIDSNLKASCNTLAKVPFDLEHWQKVAAEKYPNGLPKPYSDDPTQWIFHGLPAKSDHPLQVAIARLLGYRWPAELDAEMELSDDQRSWVKKCEALLPYTDDDGIVCIPAVRGEQTAVTRIQEMLAAAYGDKWSPQKLEDILIDAGYGNKGLERWLKDGFFEQHCKLFHQRPFIWHIWDGRKDGFGVLVNYHKLDKARLETLTYTYLGDWISRQKAAHQNGESAAGDRLSAAQCLQKKLQLILEGETPYDIFVRWKPIEAQPVGWNPDLNDGVRLNIRPFMEANIFRKKPKIKWGKDRGKNPPGSPWGEERINDRHLTLDEKMQAQKKKES
jgi:hypothetical protein